MRFTKYDEKTNTLYINSMAIMPNTRGLSFKEHHAAMKKAFSMSYTERIDAYAGNDAKIEILSELEKHAGCKISEYVNAF